MTVAPHVGARIEAVAPRTVTDSGDRIRIFVLLLVGIAIHTWLIANTYVTAKDSLGFARYALQLQEPSKSRIPQPGEPPVTVVDVLRKQDHPPGFPVAILIVSAAVKPLYHASVQDQILLSAQIASAIAGILTVFPSYWLGRSMFGKFAGFAAALLYQLLPVAAHETSDGLTEGPYIFLLATALALGVRAVKKPSVGWFLLCGLAVGASYLVRPEGLIVGLAVGLIVIVLAILRNYPRRHALAWLTALVVGALIPAAPYMILIGGITNKPTGNQMLNKIPNPREQLSKPNQSSIASKSPVFADWYDRNQDGPKVVWAAKVIALKTLKVFHYLPAVFAILGLVIALRRVRHEPWLGVPIAVMVVNLAVLFALGTLKADDHSYISERHCMPLGFVGLAFAGGILAELPRLTARWFGESSFWTGWKVPITWLFIMAVSCIPAAIKPAHESRVAHKYAGLYLAREGVLQQDDILVDPDEWAGFYSGRTLRRIDPDNPKCKYKFAVLDADDVKPKEKSEGGRTPKPRLGLAQNIANDGSNELVYWWPELEPTETNETEKRKEIESKAKVLVYRLKNTD